MVSMLDRKLLRDLWRMKGQALSIAAVVAVGIGSLVMSLSLLESLTDARRDFYNRHGFADVFIGLKRAPKTVGDRLGELPGVVQWETRLVYDVLLDIPDWQELAIGRFVSIPDSGDPRLNRLYLRRGRMLAADRSDEVVVSEIFADAHGYRPGDRIQALLNGRKQTFTLVGIVLSPEYVYAVNESVLFPDPKRFGVFWIREAALAAAFQMEGAFNSATLQLAAGASRRPVLDGADALLREYGSLGAYPRRDQISHRLVNDEIRELETMATVIPPIFLGVASFLIYITAGRLVAVQREQIASLKALGYGNAAIGMHYLKFVTLIVVAGTVMGIALGAWAGELLLDIYAVYFRFPSWEFRIPAWSLALGLGLSLLAAAGGTINSVLWVARLAPAEAMRPLAPAAFRTSWLDRVGLNRWLAPETRMALRYISHGPIRSALTTAGIACAVAVIIIGGFWTDAIDYIVQVQFGRAQRDTTYVSFTHPLAPAALQELRGMPGVLAVEGLRQVPVRLMSGPRRYLTGLSGIPEGAQLRQPLDMRLRRLSMPAEGVLLSQSLGDILQVKPGDVLQVEVLEGDRPTRDLPVVGLVNDMVGLSAYMDKSALNRWMKEGPLSSGAALLAAPGQSGALAAALKGLPQAGSVADHAAMVRTFVETFGKYINTFSALLELFASVLAVGVVYNSARIALSERAWELASLRVLGFTRGEVTRILLNKLALEHVAAIPLGYVLGYWGARWMIASMAKESYSIPLVITNRMYAIATLVVLASAALSAFLLARQIRNLDLVGVLKARD